MLSPVWHHLQDHQECPCPLRLNILVYQDVLVLLDSRKRLWDDVQSWWYFLRSFWWMLPPIWQHLHVHLFYLPYLLYLLYLLYLFYLLYFLYLLYLFYLLYLLKSAEWLLYTSTYYHDKQWYKKVIPQTLYLLFLLYSIYHSCWNKK